ncbi:MAG: STAS domain-containing protein [Spirochaetes bacterium]|nr:STAS domain-containing protein [Spirochaetota bacterium]
MKKFVRYIKHEDTVIIEVLVEKFDLFDTPKISREVEIILKRMDYPNSIIDLRKVNYVDSIGIGFLISTKNIFCNHNCEMVILCNNELVSRGFKAASMHRFFKIFLSLDESVKYVKSMSMLKK